MPDKQKKAYRDYASGMKYAEIAKKHGIPESTVKTWASRYWKNAQVSKANETIETETQPIQRKKGGRENNENAVRHGAYKKVSWDVLEDDEERDLIGSIDYDPEEMLKSNYKNLMLRERRLLKELSKRKKEGEGSKNLLLARVTKTKGGIIGDQTETVAESETNVFRIYEEELTKIQAQKTRVAVELGKIRAQGEASGNEAVDDWIAAVMEGD